MTTRRWMILVAILAALMGTVLSPRWRLCFDEAAYYASEERSLLQAAAALEQQATSRGGNAVETMIGGILASGLRATAADHARSRWEWLRAGLLPWVEPPAIVPHRESHGWRH
jgi:type II secretory pathway pseudopilin PulG